jgi:hypothetical protein
MPFSLHHQQNNSSSWLSNFRHVFSFSMFLSDFFVRRGWQNWMWVYQYKMHVRGHFVWFLNTVTILQEDSKLGALLLLLIGGAPGICPVVRWTSAPLNNTYSVWLLSLLCISCQWCSLKKSGVFSPGLSRILPSVQFAWTVLREIPLFKFAKIIRTRYIGIYKLYKMAAVVWWWWCYRLWSY